MKKKFGWIIGTLAVAMVAVGAFGTSVAYADDGGPGHRTGRLDGEGLTVVADLLGMTAEEVTSAIQDDGKTLQDLADEAGVDMQEIKDALGELRGEAVRDRALNSDAIDTIASVLGMTSAEVTAAIQDDGKTLQELADDAGVDMEDIRTALSEQRSETTRERIETALDEGTLTQAEADWLLEGVDNGFFAKLGNFFSHRGGKH
jgi:uncharacterized protein YidB (DUF937 family)